MKFSIPKIRVKTNSKEVSKGQEIALFALMIAVCLVPIWTLLQKPGLPNGTDTLYHIYRVAEMDRLWSQGVLIPHWADSFYFGYGSPLFHYYSGLTYYITSVIMRVMDVNAVDSLRWFIVLCLVGASSGMYLFMRDQVGRVAATLSALLYVYSPYIVYKEPYARGDFPELLAFVILPFLMWHMGRFLRIGGGVNFALSALSVALLILSHNLMALVLTVLVSLWVLWHWVTRSIDRRRFLLGAGAIAAGVGLTAYFWLPVFMTHDAVQLANLVTLAELDYRNFFVPLEHLLAPVPRLDHGAVNGLLLLENLGQPQWGAAVLGIITAGVAFVLGRREHRYFVAFFAVMGGVMIFLITEHSAFVWELIRPLSFLQFPWRFLGPVAFCLAVLGGLNALWIERISWSAIGWVIAPLIFFPLILSSFRLLHVPEWTNEYVETDVAAYHAAELSGRQMATTYSSEYLPVDVLFLPDPTPRLLADFADGYPVDHAHHEALPESVTVALFENGPQHSRWQVESAEAFTMEVLIFNFPNWQVTVDGQAVPIQSSDPHGLITFDVPAGSHEVALFFGTTPALMLGLVLGLVALTGIVVALVRLRPVGFTAPDERDFSGVVSEFCFGLVLVLGCISTNLRTWFDVDNMLRYNSLPGEAKPAQVKTVYGLGEDIRLIGYDLNREVFSPGDRLELTVYWYAEATPEYGYNSFVHVAAGGPPVAQADKLNPAGRPTKEWTDAGYILDPYVIRLPEDLPAGEYTLTVGLYTCETLPAGECGNGDRLQVFDEQGTAVGDMVPLTTIQVR